MPLSRHSGAPRTGRVGWQAALLADCRVAPGEANLYPVNPISTRGASELILERYWRKEGRAGNELCAAIGIVGAVVIRQILAVAGINDYVIAPLLTYAGLAVSATLLAWLFWFGH